MAEQPLSGNLPLSLAPDAGMKSVPVMVHTQDQLAWGDIQISENLLVSLVLQGTEVPDFVSLSDAKIVSVDKGLNGGADSFSELHIPTHTILGFHLMPPHTEPPDYDADEPNRKMEPVVAKVGNFIFHGHARMSTQTNIKSFLEVTRAEFVSLYDLEIVHRLGGSQPPIKVDTAQIRRLSAAWGSSN
ncbi:MAG: hypothetical protein OEV06_12450 [Anaerolineae bacterium]|nr:hypothetical protein [Anaerolineae bacterium]